MDAPDPSERLAPRPAEPERPARPRKIRRESRLLAFVRGVSTFAFIVFMIGLGVAGLVGYTAYQHYAADLPSLDGLRTYQPPVMSRVYAGDDRLMAELATERRIFVPLTAIPDRVRQAFIAAEDENFYSHRGIDPLAILRAAYADLHRIRSGRRPEGASTITQQVARNMLLGSNEPTFRRKVREALLALRLDRTLSKDRILELYLNQIYLGQGSYGVAAAAQTYFNKPLDQLDIAEAAMLAALPKSPTKYNPFHFPQAARDRRDWVIGRMVDTHAITEAEATAAQAEPLLPSAYRRPDAVPGSDWFMAEVKRRLLERFGPDQTTEGGLIVHTSFDPALQARADAALQAGLLAYDHSHGGWRGPIRHVDAPVAPTDDWQDVLAKESAPPGMLPGWRLALVLQETAAAAKLGWFDPAPGGEARMGTIRLGDLGWARHVSPDGDIGAAPRRMSDVMRPGDLVMIEERDAAPDHPILRQIPKVEGALVAMDPHTGRVLAMSGGWSGNASQFNRATQALRQPGSSFKPFVYLAAMEKGISPSARFLDEPFSLGNWHPNNYELNTGGPTPLHVALEQSLNLVTVRVAAHIGMDAVAKTAIAYHLYDSMPRVLPASLGAVETTVLREAGAYSSIEDGGRVVVPSLIDSVQDRDGHVVWRPQGLVFGPSDPQHPPTLMDPREQVADPASAFQVLMMMRGVVEHGTGVPVVAGLDRPIAGKTGTSQDYNDAWFAGFTPDLVVVVWVGFDQPQTLGDKQTGAAVAGPIWHDFVKSALGDSPVLQFRPPEGVTIASWPCGAHDCVDAFKPGQIPGAAGIGPSAENSDAAGPSVQMLDAASGDPNGGTQPAVPGAQPPPPPGTGVDSGVGGLY